MEIRDIFERADVGIGPYTGLFDTLKWDCHRQSHLLYGIRIWL